MPTAKPNTRVHATPPPVNHRMWLDLFVDTPYGPSDLCSIDAYLHHYAEGLQHSWTGQLKIGDKFAGPTHGLLHIDLPEPDRGGRPEKKSRDIAIFLAFKYFEALDCPSPRERVFQLWQKRRAESSRGASTEHAAAAVCVEKELPLKSVKTKGTHKGITDVSKVSTACTRAKEKMDTTMLNVIGATAPFCEADGWTIGGVGEDVISLAKETRMILRQKGSRIDRIENSPNRCVIHGPCWVWAMGDEDAVRVPEGGGMDVTFDTEVPSGWFD